MLQCPVCDRGMKEVSARANPGTLIVLDQCPRCGGIWCDKWELFPVQPDEAPQLDPLDKKRLQMPVKLDKRLYCPRCTDRLATMRDPVLPSEIQLQRCRRCDGIWLNRGQFGLYKAFQKKTRQNKFAGKAAFHKVAKAYQDPKSWVTVGTRGIYAYPRAVDEQEDLPRITTRRAFLLILQTLLGLLWRF